ncbi:MAG: hypothetical protein K2L96_08080, partial [Muribaculaceae bacterium]|nr:hypothetical protein [Muribaculaceae bacterium]
PVRCPDWEEENFGYYKMYFNTDNNGEYTHLRTVCEDGEPSSLFWPEYDSYIRVTYQNLRDQEVDLKNELIMDSDFFDEMKPLFSKGTISKDYSQFVALEDITVMTEAPAYAHLLDKDNELYRSGLRDGDIILGKGLQTGATGIRVIHFDGSKYATKDIRFSRALTKDDLEHIHVHKLKLSREEYTRIRKDIPNLDNLI